MKDAGKFLCPKGYDGVSVREICEKAGVNASLISYHFEGKTGLYKTCLAHFADRRLAAIGESYSLPKTPEEFRFRIQLFVEELVGCQANQPEISRINHRGMALRTDIASELFDDIFISLFGSYPVSGPRPRR